ncbi:helix-turn-helix domain-containing protein [Bacillus amyloliquefaciens]|uniref:helix-turn-helix domain-containing protein n=1 Tax=Bacillus amyloliquefaciens TaxID=1390 RepID=UPI002D80A04C|nr:helix-turn-helix transcriptional regulator [Bacillus amyloliquefaciens]MEB4593924.1 helix-turn-helix domain-containing protein [Bacillus amyloliquefaciens]
MLIVKPKLTAILKKKKMTQTELSILSNVPQSAISRFDKSEQHKDSHLFSISKALNLSIEELFYVEETKKSSSQGE